MNKSRFKLGWFNAWIGYASILLLIPSGLFFLNYEVFLNRSFLSEIVNLKRIEIKKDTSQIGIITDKGTFFHYNKNNYQKIFELYGLNQPVTIWYDEKDRNVADFEAEGKFLLKGSGLSPFLYGIGLIISGTMVILSTLLIIKTKGWGTYELMEKHKKV